MCEYIKARFPHIYLYTSTNGLAFSEAQVRRLVHSGIDEVTFSIDGATQESYARTGSAATSTKAIQNRAPPTRSGAAGATCPFINWRYILFTHNDSEEEMALARRMAAEIGVDRLCWELTDHPEDMFSRRFLPGSEALAVIRHEVWDDNNLGNAIPGATPRAEIAVREPRAGAARRRSPREQGDPEGAGAQRLHARPFPAQASYGRRLVRLGAQLCRPDGTLLNRDYERAWLPDTLQPGAAVDVPVTITAPSEPGRYALKFDLVSEGIDWFEACGSPTTTKTLIVI
jgi:hypothetical protein